MAADEAEALHCCEEKERLCEQWAAARRELAAAKRELEKVQRAGADAEAVAAKGARGDEEALSLQQMRSAAEAADGIVNDWVGSVAELQAEHNTESAELRGNRFGLKMTLLEGEAGHEQLLQCVKARVMGGALLRPFCLRAPCGTEAASCTQQHASNTRTAQDSESGARPRGVGDALGV